MASLLESIKERHEQRQALYVEQEREKADLKRRQQQQRLAVQQQASTTATSLLKKHSKKKRGQDVPHSSPLLSLHEPAKQNYLLPHRAESLNTTEQFLERRIVSERKRRAGRGRVANRGTHRSRNSSSSLHHDTVTLRSTKQGGRGQWLYRTTQPQQASTLTATLPTSSPPQRLLGGKPNRLVSSLLPERATNTVLVHDEGGSGGSHWTLAPLEHLYTSLSAVASPQPRVEKQTRRTLLSSSSTTRRSRLFVQAVHSRHPLMLRSFTNILWHGVCFLPFATAAHVFCAKVTFPIACAGLLTAPVGTEVLRVWKRFYAPRSPAAVKRVMDQAPHLKERTFARWMSSGKPLVGQSLVLTFIGCATWCGLYTGFNHHHLFIGTNSYDRVNTTESAALLNAAVQRQRRLDRLKEIALLRGEDQDGLAWVASHGGSSQNVGLLESFYLQLNIAKLSWQSGIPIDTLRSIFGQAKNGDASTTNNGGWHEGGAESGGSHLFNESGSSLSREDTLHLLAGSTSLTSSTKLITAESVLDFSLELLAIDPPPSLMNKFVWEHLGSASLVQSSLSTTHGSPAVWGHEGQHMVFRQPL